MSKKLRAIPPDFRLSATDDEAEALRCQIGISNKGRGGESKVDGG